MFPGAVVFDLFHTLVDTEHLRPVGFSEVESVARVIGAEPSGFAQFWAETYVERETSMLDLGDLTARYCNQIGLLLDFAQLDEIDTVFGVCKDEALRQPEPAMVELVATVASGSVIGVLSNCHAREVRAWSASPFVDYVAVFGRSCEIGFMKPDVRCYQWVMDRLGVDTGDATFVGNGASGELDGARAAGFARIVHCNIFDAVNGIVPLDEQSRRASQADVSVSTIDDLRAAISGHP